MMNADFNLGRYQFDGQTVIGRPDGDFIDVLSDSDDLPRVLASLESNPLPRRRIPAAATRLLPPLDPRARVFSIAVNYVAHGAEAKVLPPSRPVMFYKAPSNFVGHGEKLNPNKHLTAKFDYEGEIAVVIGRTCKDATVDNALDFVAAVCAFDDGSARDLGKVSLGPDGPDAKYWPDWTANKGLDGGSAIGPTLSCGPTVLKALRERSLTITTRLNGEQVQHESMKEMVFSTEEMIAALSSYMTLLPGDVIATGTPSGIGGARGRFLATGDVLEIEVSGLDVLRVKVG
jgi:2-keto-4-pentenoate hydratase/2-oxohepta-3-ene-1,7-dioic acid hydratase in catechol pathway